MFNKLRSKFSKTLSVRSKVLLTTGLTTAVGIGYIIATDEGTRRSIKFWSNVFPMYLHYRSIQALNSDLNCISDEYANKWYETLHDQYTDRVKEITYDMKGFYLKHAQLMSMQDDFVPMQYMKWLKDTQSNVPSQFKSQSDAKAYVAKLSQEELNIPFDKLFSSWDDEPLGIASIGQVHKAVLRSTGQPVAVKFLCPGIEQKFRSDIRTLKSFCQLAMPQHVSAFNETEKQFLTEFDYRNEAKALNLARNHTLPSWGKKVNIPEAYTEICSQNLLIMEFLDGIKLVDGIKQQYAKLAALAGKTLDELETERKEAIANGTYQYHSIEDEKWSTFTTRMYLLINDIWRYNIPSFLHNYGPTRLIWHDAKKYQWTEIPIDLGATLELLCQIQADNMFKYGQFNGDAHPGNMMLLKDGRVGLIDYGQFKTMSLQHRIVYAKMIIALARDDKQEIIRLYFNEVETKTKYSNPEIAYKLACFWNDRDTEDIMGSHNIATFIDYCQLHDPMIQVGEDFIFAARASLMLRGMGKAFGLQLRISHIWRKAAENFLKSQHIDY